MHKFKVGESVIVNYGTEKNKIAIIKKLQQGLVYTVCIDNEIGYYSEMSLMPIVTMNQNIS